MCTRGYHDSTAFCAERWIQQRCSAALRSSNMNKVLLQAFSTLCFTARVVVGPEADSQMSLSRQILCLVSSCPDGIDSVEVSDTVESTFILLIISYEAAVR